MAFRRRQPNERDARLTRRERAEIATLAAQVKELRASIDRLHEAIEAQERKRATDVESGRRRVDDLENQLASVAADHAAALERVRLRAAADVDSVRRDATARLEAAIESERTAHATDLAAATTAQQHELARVEAAAAAELAATTSAHQQELARVETAAAEALAAVSARHEVGLARLRGDLADSLDGLRTSFGERLEEQGRVHAADLTALREEHAQRLEATEVERHRALDELQAEQETRLAGIRHEQASGLAERDAAISDLRDVIAGNSHEHALALAAARVEIEGRLVEATERHRDLLATVDATSTRLDRHQEEVEDRFASVDGVNARIEERMSRDEKRIEQAVSGLHRVDLLSDEIDEVKDRVTGAELLLNQRDTTDFEIQLERMEAFERLAAETNPDQFAQRSEVDALRLRLDEFMPTAMEENHREG